MSLLNSKFDIVSRDNAVSYASLAQVLVSGTMTLGANGTPTPGTFPPGSLVTMNTSGQAVLAVDPSAGAGAPNKKLVFVTVDGDTDYSGSFVRKLTVLHGGVTIETDLYVAGSYQPGLPVTYGTGGNAGRIALANAANDQIIGFVGPSGLDATRGVLEVILPQGCGV